MFTDRDRRRCQELYDRYYAGRKFHDSLYRDLIRRYLRPGDTLLDAGCGRYLRFCREFAQDAHVVGMLTHRDLLAVSPSSLDPTVTRARIALSASVHVADVMETHVSVVGTDELAATAGERMLRHKIGCLPVVDADGRLVGIVTADDFVRWAAEHMRPEPAARRSA